MSRIKSKILSYFLTFVLLVGLMPTWITVASAAWEGGSDTEWYTADTTAASFTIDTENELSGLASLVNAGNDFAGKTIILNASLDLGTNTWIPIGTGTPYTTQRHPFQGIFDGGGFTVSGTVTASGSSSADASGLFGYVGGNAVIKNLNVNLDVAYNYTSGGTYIGTLAGYNLGTLINCAAAGSVSADNSFNCVFAGGLAGYNDGTILHCSSTADAFSGAKNNYSVAGGLVGQCWYQSVIIDCYAKGAVTAKGEGSQTGIFAGGFVGYNAGTVKNSYCTQTTITTSQTADGSTTYVGGFAGQNYAPTGILLNAYYNSAYTGGIGNKNGSHVNDVQGISAEVMTGEEGEVSYHTGYTQTDIYHDAVYTGYTVSAASFVGALNAGSKAQSFANGDVWAEDSGNVNGGYPVLTNYVYASALNIQGEGGADTITMEGGTLQLSAEASSATYNMVTWSVVSGDCGTLNSTGLLKAKYNGEITVRATSTENPNVYCDKTITVSGLPANWQEAGFAASAFDSGDGSEADPYQIKTAGQLAYLAKTVNAGTDYSGKYIVLTDDISLSGRQWMPIGWYDEIYDKNYEFKGIFDGAGHEITGLSIGTNGSPNSTLAYSALFGRTNGGSISNTAVETQIISAYTSSDKFCVGGLAGYMADTAVTNCRVSGSITASGTGSAFAGGIGAYVDLAEISNCSAKADLTAAGSSSSVGGLIGCLYSSTVINSHSNGDVTTSESNSYAGGLVGTAYGTISKSYATGSVAAGDDSSAGGLVGNSVSAIQDCFATGNVSAGKAAGEYNCTYVGGFAGENDSTILNCYASGNVTIGEASDNGVAYAGGFTGCNMYLDTAATGTIENCYVAGAVSGGSGSLTGGFVGTNTSISSSSPFGTIINSYYDETKNAGAAVGQNDALNSHVTGLTTPQMTGTNTDSLDITYYTSYTDVTTNSSSSAETLIDALNGGCLLCGNPEDFSVWSEGTGGYPEFIKYWKDYTERFAGGSGTAGNPYQIATAGQLAYLAKLVNDGTGSYGSGCYKLTADIGLSGKQWTPIGAADPFNGTFNGNGHIITGLNIGSSFAPDSAFYCAGLFVWLDSNATVENVGVVNAAIYSSKDCVYAGILTGGNDGTIRDSYTSGTVITIGSGDEDNMALAGGFAGSNNGTIQNSYSTSNVTACGEYSFAGGFAGMNDHYSSEYHGVIENCYAAGSVTATGEGSYSGGFAGTNTNWNEIAYKETEDPGVYGTLKNDYYNSTLNVGEGVGQEHASDSHVVGLTTEAMKDSVSTITYYTSDSDTLGTAASSFTTALNGGRTLLGIGYTYKSWKIDGSTNSGYPVLYTPASSGDGSGSGSSSAGSNTETNTADGTTTATTNVTANTGANGAAAAAVKASQISDALSRAAEQAASQGAERQVVEISVGGASSATGVSTTIPHSAFDTVANSSANALTVRTSVGMVSLDSTALDIINQNSSGDVTISIAHADTSSMTEEQQAVIGGRPVYNLTVTSGGTVISSFGGGSATVSIPYTLTAGENPNEVVIYYLSDSGELVLVPNCVYNASTGTITFTTVHFSSYVVGYNDVKFADVSGWYEDYVNYLAARNIVQGSGNSDFSPDADITRAQFVTILANLSGDDLSGYTTSAFSDVSTSDWFFKAVQWAHKNGVALGSDGRFDPNENITRQDIAVMITRYADKVANYTLPKTSSTVTFTDCNEIADYASEAVSAMHRAGIISGNDDGSFAPKSNATRAQAATMIARLLQGILE